MAAVVSTSCPDLKLIARGKVRDLYEVDEHSLLFVATDRISAFDVIMQNVNLFFFLVALIQDQE
jgi:phosphoribosylaminoimidazole-succinocarboxamide synthase